MKIGQDQSLPHFYRWLLKFVIGDLQISERPDSIDIPPEYLHKVQDHTGIVIRKSHRHFVEKVFPNTNAKFHPSDLHLIRG